MVKSALMDVDYEAVEAIYGRMMDYRSDPIGFACNILSLKPEYVWSKMEELAAGVVNHQKVAVRAGHSVSKTFSLGRIIVPWFKTCFQPSTVITTAPSDNQVKNQLWREIRAAYAGAQVPLGGQIHTLHWDMRPSEDVLATLEPAEREQWEKNFAIGFSTSPDTSTEHATKMQGWHNEYVLVVIDEACGIAPQIWRTVMESLIVDEQCKVVAIGNPTDPECDFARACFSSDPEKNEGNAPYVSDEGWYVITISGKDTPNYKQGRRVIPSLAGREYVDGIIKKYGENGDGTRYRVKGLFPTYKEGTFYGYLLSQARKQGRVGHFPHDPTAKVFTANDYGDMYSATIFLQLIQGRIRIIDDYWDYDGLGMPNWATVCRAKPYVYGGHFAGPDFAGSNAKSHQTGKTAKDTAAQLTFAVEAVCRHAFNDGIEAVRGIWPLLEINEQTCRTFLKAASGYGKKKNEALSTDEHVVYHKEVAATWHVHMMDALRHLAMQYRYGYIEGEIRGATRPMSQWEVGDEFEQEQADLLGIN